MEKEKELEAALESSAANLDEITPTPEPLKDEPKIDTSETSDLASIVKDLIAKLKIESEDDDSQFKPTPEQLEAINKLSKRTLSADEVRVFPLKFIGDGLIERRKMSFSKEALHDFAKYANQGVSFMLDHSWSKFFGGPLAMPYGRTFGASVAKSKQEDGTPFKEENALYGYVYLVKGKDIAGISTDTVIDSMEDGTLSDVSVTVSVDHYNCSICGEDIWSDKCKHRMGETYDNQMAYAIGQSPGRLYEISGVYDGAYESAKTLSADNKDFEYEEIDDLKDLKNYRGSEILHVCSANGVTTFAKKPKVVAPTIDVERAKDVAGENWQENIFKLASDGKALREDLVKDALKWGVTAMYDKFDEDFYRKQFSEMPIEMIKSQRDQWQAMAHAVIPTERKIGRSLGSAKTKIPDSQFKV